MSKAFKRGQLLEEKDLVIKVRGQDGVLFDPYLINYSIIDATVSPEVLLNNHSTRVPVRRQSGVYYAVYPIPAGANLGSWKIVWHIQELENTPSFDYEQCFSVVSSDALIPTNQNDFVSKILDTLDITMTPDSDC